MAPAPPSETLFADIATPRSEQRYPATQVIYDLVRHIGADVSSFRRNSQISYRLVELARDLHDEINRRIGEVELSGDWDMYDAYTQAIDPLEELLFDIAAVTDEEQDEHLLTASSVEECKQSIEKWIKNRRSIRDCFSGLRADDKLKKLVPAPNDDEDDIFHAAAHDDRGFLNNLLTAIRTNTSNISRRKTKALLQKVTIGLESIQNMPLDNSKKSIEEGLTIISIKCAMIVYGVTKIIIEKPVQQDLLDHYHSDMVWDAAQKLINDVFEGLNSRKFTLADLEAEYTSFENTLLQVTTVDIPASYRRLVSFIGKIGRAYHAQSLVLVLLCREAVSHFQNNKNMANYDALERQGAFEETIKALEAATQLATAQAKNLAAGTTNQVNGDTTTAQTLDGSQSPASEVSADSMGAAHIVSEESCTKLFEDSADALKACFQEIGLDAVTDHRERLSEAQSKDRARTEQVKQKLTRAVPTTTSQLVSITLNVHENSQTGQPLKKLTCTALATARLSFIKWSAAKQVPELDLSDPETSYFEKPLAEGDDQPTRISLEDSIKSLSEERKITLCLIVKKD